MPLSRSFFFIGLDDWTTLPNAHIRPFFLNVIGKKWKSGLGSGHFAERPLPSSGIAATRRGPGAMGSARARPGPILSGLKIRAPTKTGGDAPQRWALPEATQKAERNAAKTQRHVAASAKSERHVAAGPRADLSRVLLPISARRKDLGQVGAAPKDDRPVGKAVYSA